MLTAALRDLQWRRRRFAIAIVGTGLVFGLTLLISGVSNGFGVETDQTVSRLGLTGWYVKAGSAGPFLGASPMPAQMVDMVRGLPGLTKAGPTVFTRKGVIKDGGEIVDVNVFGAAVDGPGMPTADDGHPPKRPGEVAVSTRLKGYRIGQTLKMAGREFTIVGRVNRSSALGGAPNVFLTLPDAQAVAFAGLPAMSAIGVVGRPPAPPAGLSFIPEKDGSADILRAVAQARSGISLITVLLWVVAASIVGTITYLSALERQRDFAVFKATGVGSAAIFGGLALQSVLLAVASAIVGAFIAVLLAPRFPMQVAYSRSTFLVLPVVAMIVGLLASLTSIRRTVAVDPAIAFGGP